MKPSKAKQKKSPPKKDKEESKQGFPGYEKYGPEEDITRRGKRLEGSLDDEPDNIPPKEENYRRGSSDSDVTKEDLEALGPKDLSMDMGDDEQLKHREQPVDFAGSDLDVPGSELDDADEETGNEDEENNSYSLGGEKDS